MFVIVLFLVIVSMPMVSVLFKELQMLKDRNQFDVYVSTSRREIGYVNPCIPTQTPEEDKSDYMQSPG